MGEMKPGSEAAKIEGLALAQIYNYIRTGKVKNHKADGWPTGKGIIVDMDEVRAAKSSGRTRAPKGAKASASGGGRVSRKARHEDEVSMHEALDDEERDRRARKRASGEDGNSVRLRRLDRTSKYPACPVDPSHGELALVTRESTEKKRKSSDSGVRLQCWHQSHDGRPKGHAGGYAPQTKSIFTEEEAQTPQPVGRLGAIMLEWIMQGRTDLSESLESWMIKNGLPVWIPTR